MWLACYMSSVIFSYLYQLNSIKVLNFSYLLQRSRCDHCCTVLKWYNLFPIFSYIFLKGKSGCCQKQLSPNYLIGESLSFLVMLIAMIFPLSINHSLFLTSFLFLLVMGLYDIETKTINVIILCLFFIVTFSITPHYLYSASFLILILHLTYFILKDKIGYGDILLLSILSFFFSYLFMVTLIILTCVIALCFSLVFLILKLKYIKCLPLVPFIFASFVINAFFFYSINSIIEGLII